MGPVDIAHILVIAVVLVLSIAIFVRIYRIYREGSPGEEGGRYIYSIAEQQILPQMVVVVRYVKRLALSWEYLLLIVALSSLALTASYPLQSESRYVHTAQPGQGFPEYALFLYSRKGIDIGESLPGVVVKVYYIALEEPLVIQTGGRILRVFSAMLVWCYLQEASAGYLGVWSTIFRPCLYGDTAYIYPPEEAPARAGSRALLYYGDEGFNITLEPYPREILWTVGNTACLGEVLTSMFRQMEYSGGVVASASLLGEAVGAGMPSIVIAIGDYGGRLNSSFLSSIGVEIACYRVNGSGEVVKYVREDIGGASEHIYPLIAGVTAGFLLILFNRSLAHRIAPSSSAILISGGTAWISSIIPVVSLAFMELTAILFSIAVYGVARVLSPPGYGAPISPLGVLVIVSSSILVSLAHMLYIRSRSGALYTYVERPIPVRSYSSVVEGYSPKDLLSVVVLSLEESEFFDVVEREVFEQGGRINARLRLAYRYSIGVGADVNIYITPYDRGLFLEVDVEPWSIDTGEGGSLDTVSRLVLSRISGGVYVDQISRGSGQS